MLVESNTNHPNSCAKMQLKRCYGSGIVFKIQFRPCPPSLKARFKLKTCLCGISEINLALSLYKFTKNGVHVPFTS